MKNVQITIDEDTLAAVDKAGKPLGLKRSEIVRRALREWLDRRAIQEFEKEWIRALEAVPDDKASADRWGRAQAWSKK